MNLANIKKVKLLEKELPFLFETDNDSILGNLELENSYIEIWTSSDQLFEFLFSQIGGVVEHDIMGNPVCIKKGSNIGNISLAWEIWNLLINKDIQ